MTTVEQEPVITESTEVSEDNHEDPLECHLYLTKSHAMCGLPSKQDPHPQRCKGRSPWHKGMTACPVCAAPLCVECLLAAS